MARDLGTEGGQVHDAAAHVLAFWLEDTPPERRFARDDALDVRIFTAFHDVRAEVLRTYAAAWRGDPRTLLAAIILLDQFSRNMFRDDPRAYEGDPLARALARQAMEAGWGAGMTDAERQFLHMPFMHSEAMADQLLSLDLFGPDDRWALPHARQIARFGRFPQRNAALGRATTAAEAAFLEDPANHF